MRLKLLLLTLVLTGSIGMLSAKDNDSSAFTVKEKYQLRRGDFAVKSSDYESALSIYLELYTNHKDDAQINANLAKAYFKSNNLLDAEYHFTRVTELNKDVDAYFHVDYGHYLLSKGEYEKALIQFENFKKKDPNKKDLKFSHVEDFILQCKGAITNKENVKVQVNALSNKVNSEYTDAAPGITADGKTLIFNSRRPINKGGQMAPDGQFFEDVFIATWNDKTNNWNKATPAEGAVNTDEHDAATSISADGQQMLVYQNILGVTKSGDIYLSKKGSNGRWGRAKAFEEINSGFFESSACFSVDGKKVFFISERKKGLGNGDIYFSEKVEGKWSEPKNIGDIVNTSEDEVGLFLHPDGKTLFFASKGHYEQNYGGYDIFKTVLGEDSVWSKPENLGAPINTFRDERHFVLNSDGDKGYFTGQRQVGRSDLDIYEVDFSKYNPMTGETVAETQFTILKGLISDSKTGSKLTGQLIITDLETNEVSMMEVDEEGEFFMTLPGNKKYNLAVIKEGYDAFRQELTLPVGNDNETISFENDILLVSQREIEVIDKRLFSVQTVRFDKSSAKTEFSEVVKTELDLFVEQLKKAPSYSVELSGYTDNTGSVSGNKKLSKQRASMVATYFREHGIEFSRIIIIGHGPEKAIADNSTEEGRAQNRRVEIKLFEK
jgi:outer membrane protein OmpA-like peptidoglycan-associated protein/tetratricopeptide (TPR) repeat protein